MNELQARDDANPWNGAQTNGVQCRHNADYKQI